VAPEGTPLEGVLQDFAAERRSDHGEQLLPIASKQHQLATERALVGRLQIVEERVHAVVHLTIINFIVNFNKYSKNKTMVTIPTN